MANLVQMNYVMHKSIKRRLSFTNHNIKTYSGLLQEHFCKNVERKQEMLLMRCNIHEQSNFMMVAVIALKMSLLLAEFLQKRLMKIPAETCILWQRIFHGPMLAHIMVIAALIFV